MNATHSALLSIVAISGPRVFRRDGRGFRYRLPADFRSQSLAT